MKYIKSYKIFEDRVDDIINRVKTELFPRMEDENIEISISKNQFSIFTKGLWRFLEGSKTPDISCGMNSPRNPQPFDLNYAQYVHYLIKFMDSSGYKILDFRIGLQYTGINVVKNGKLCYKSSHDPVTWVENHLVEQGNPLIYSIGINFIKK